MSSILKVLASAAFLCLVGAPAYAQDAASVSGDIPGEEGGCFGVPRLHCGPSTSLFEVRPGLSAPAELAPGLGPEFDYHFEKWTVGGALFLNGLLPLGSSPTTPPAEIGVAAFACLGPGFGALNGICAGPLLAFQPSNFSNFKWKNNLGVVFNLAPDMLSTLSTDVAQLVEEL